MMMKLFRNYTSSSKAINASEIVPLLDEPSTSTASTSATKKISMNNSKVAPIISKATLISKSNIQPASVKPSSLGFKPYTVSSAPSTSKSSTAALKPTNQVSSKDNKKNDNKKNDEKLKQKADKEAKKVNKIDGCMASQNDYLKFPTGRKTAGKRRGKVGKVESKGREEAWKDWTESTSSREYLKNISKKIFPSRDAKQKKFILSAFDGLH